MKLSQLLNEDDAVSPVIGVILMVAITVILAAVIGTFVLGLGENVQTTAPQASFNSNYQNTTSFTAAPDDDGYADDKLTLTHSGGDTVKGTNLMLSTTGVIGNTSEAAPEPAQNNDLQLKDGSNTWDKVSATSGDVTAGQSITLKSSDFETSGGDGADSLSLHKATITVNWQSTNGDSSATLAEWEGPNA